MGMMNKEQLIEYKASLEADNRRTCMRYKYPEPGKTNVQVIYKGVEYKIVNERNGEVELWRNGKFAFLAKQLKNGTIRKLKQANGVFVGDNGPTMGMGY